MKYLYFLLTLTLWTIPGHGQFLRSEFLKKPKALRNIQTTETSLTEIQFPEEGIPYTKFRETYSHLDDQSFNLKIQGALSTSPLLFFRSFVNTYYADISEFNTSPNLVLCLGDTHPENFGFIQFTSHVRFVYNDLDDSGVCPLEYEILRYFTSATLAFNDDALIKSLLEEYVAVVNRKKEPDVISEKLVPDLNKKRKKLLNQYTDLKSKLTGKDLIIIAPETKKILLQELKKAPSFKTIAILDIAEVPRDTGGSAGLKRYLILLSNPTGLELIELKELSKSGTSYGAWTQPNWSQEERIEKAKQYIWKETLEHYHVVQLQGKEFLTRSKVKDSVDIEDLSAKDLRSYLLVQAGWLANYHRTFVQTEVPGLMEWVQRNLPVLVKRYDKTFKNLKK